MSAAPLPRSLYALSAVELAPRLLGCLLCHETAEGMAAGIIVEAEAYAGPEDDGAHSYGGRRTARTAIQY
ncbi:MAG: DNA-3-methyladenine glycosylase, partial [Oscillospiraceae bacterium]|nr:DNA-3-methyladenine glycosylase [Oscillospiraceae bacterium]